MTKTDRTFMGIKITGAGYGNGYSRAVQQPIEDLYPIFKRAFDSGAKAIKWNQYTPGFNDGDPCEFTVGMPHVTSNAEVARAWLDNDIPDLELAYGPQAGYYDEYEYSYDGTHPDGKEMDDLVGTIPVEAEAFEDALRATFGNYTEIVVTPESVVQFDYDCGY